MEKLTVLQTTRRTTAGKMRENYNFIYIRLKTVETELHMNPLPGQPNEYCKCVITGDVLMKFSFGSK